jgi:hypothetical protein
MTMSEVEHATADMAAAGCPADRSAAAPRGACGATVQSSLPNISAPQKRAADAASSSVDAQVRKRVSRKTSHIPKPTGPAPPCPRCEAGSDLTKFWCDFTLDVLQNMLLTMACMSSCVLLCTVSHLIPLPEDRAEHTVENQLRDGYRCCSHCIEMYLRPVEPTSCQLTKLLYPFIVAVLRCSYYNNGKPDQARYYCKACERCARTPRHEQFACPCLGCVHRRLAELLYAAAAVASRRSAPQRVSCTARMEDNLTLRAL